MGNEVGHKFNLGEKACEPLLGECSNQRWKISTRPYLLWKKLGVVLEEANEFEEKYRRKY